MPIITHVVEFLTELVRSGKILLSDDMKRWMGEVVCAMWLRLYRSKFRKDCWVTVQNHFGHCFDFSRFNFENWMRPDMDQDTFPVAIFAKALPPGIVKVFVVHEGQLLQCFTDFRHFLITGQLPGEYRKDGERLVTLKGLEQEFGERKARLPDKVVFMCLPSIMKQISCIGTTQHKGSVKQILS